MDLQKLNYRIINFLRATLDPATIPVAVTDGTLLIPACDAKGITLVRSADGSYGSAGTSSVSAPAAGNQASVTLPADPAKKYNAISLSWGLGDTAAIAAPLTLVIRDGARGVGTILWSKKIGPILAGDSKQGDITWPPGYGPGNAAVNTAFTAEFTTAGSATGTQSVSLVAYKSGA